MLLGEILVASFSVIEDLDAGEISLKSDLTPMGLLDGFLIPDFTGRQEANEGLALDGGGSEIVLDRDTYQIKKVIFDVIEIIEDMNQNEFSLEMSMHAEVTCSDYNGDFEIVVPEDVKENAVELLNDPEDFF